MTQHPVTMASPDEGDQHGHDDHHGGSLKTYIAVFFALCVLTGASFLTYSDLWRNTFSPHTGWAFMMAVSCTKAMLVILFFMHLKYEAGWKYVLTIPAISMSIFLVLMLVPDVGLRLGRASEERLRHMAVSVPHTDAGGASHAPDGHDKPGVE